MSDADIAVAAPPELPQAPSSGVLVRVLPLVMSVATLGVMAAVFLSRSSVTPTFLAFPVMMLASVAVTAVTGRGRRYGAELDADRVDYLAYLNGLRRTVTEIGVAQRVSLNREHPEPETLWALIGGPEMWRRRRADPNFCHVRVGVGTRPLAARLIEPETRPAQRSDPVTVTALRHFLRTYSTITDAPVVIPLLGIACVTIDGDPAKVRALIRAMICQLAVQHAPDELLIVGAISEGNRAQWEWLKWLPHNQHPDATDALGPVRMVYSSLAEAHSAAAAAGSPHAVVVVDTGDCTGPAIGGAVTLEVGTGPDGAPVTIRHPGEAQAMVRPDQLDLADALVCARRLAAHRVHEPAVGRDGSCDPTTLWRSQPGHERLCVPIGITVDGTPLRLDIKEPAENGMGPHGLCVGCTGSGKSELLRTVALGMMARNSPEVLNLLLIDFKGGATFLDLARAPHVSAVITNLAEEAPLVERMRDALSGEMNRRQQLLRTAGNFVSVAAYERARRAGARFTALPTLFIIVDEFSELFSQHPDLADVFVAIGRLGRSLGMHLLLASQRLDEGRLRGLDAHLSYRICLKTLSASESRTVLGTLDAYELPGTPGAGFLRSATGELIGFQAAFVSGPYRTRAAARPAAAPSVQRFTTHAAGPVTRAGADETAAPTRTVLHAVLDRLAGQGPPAHQVWLPPLEAVGLQTLLRNAEGAPHLAVPIGIVDRPFEQRRTPLIADLSGAAGNVAVVGAPRSGKSMALRTLITALAATHDAGRVQFYCLDFGGGALASMCSLPHVGAVAGRGEPQLVSRIVAELESLIRSRDRSEPDAFGDVFLVIDGWARLRHEFEALEESITALAAQGLSFGVHVVLSASRWTEIRPSLRDQIGTRIELRLGDPADSELDRKQAQRVPHDRPGRGLSRDGLHMMIALPGPVGVVSVPGLVAPPMPLLPTRVDYDAVVQRTGAGILLGLEERRLDSLTVDFDLHRHLLIIGDNECGKTAALRVLCREIVRTKTAEQGRLFIVDFRRTLLGVVESEHLGGYAMSPAALDELLPALLDLLRDRMPPPHVTQAQLRTRSWWSGPDIYVMVDDYDLVATATGNPLSAMLEYLPHAGDLGLHLIVARRSGGAARALFEPLLAGLRDLGCMTLMMSGRPDDGVLFGSVHPTPLPPGRGVLIARPGEEQRIQVAWSPP